MIQVRNPYNLELIGEVEETSEQELNTLIGRAASAFKNNALPAIDRFKSPRDFSAVTRKMKEFLARYYEKNCISDVIPSDIKPMISDILNVRI